MQTTTWQQELAAHVKDEITRHVGADKWDPSEWEDFIRWRCRRVSAPAVANEDPMKDQITKTVVEQMKAPPVSEYWQDYYKARSELEVLIDEDNGKYRVVPCEGDDPYADMQGVVSNPVDLRLRLLKSKKPRDASRKLLHVVVDGIEQKLLYLLDQICFSTAKLDLFDYVYTIDGTSFDWNDRKGRTDLSMSYERCMNQKARALSTRFPKHKISWVVEGLGGHADYLKPLSFYSKFNASTIHVDGMNSYKEENVLSHATNIIRRVIAIARRGDKSFENGMAPIVSPIETKKFGAANGAEPVLGLTSKKQVTPFNCLKYMLSVIPKVSAAMGKEVMKRYPSVTALLNAYNALSSDAERMLLLAEIMVGKRRFGPAASTAVFCYLHAEMRELPAAAQPRRKRKREEVATAN